MSENKQPLAKALHVEAIKFSKQQINAGQHSTDSTVIFTTRGGRSFCDERKCKGWKILLLSSGEHNFSRGCISDSLAEGSFLMLLKPGEKDQI